MRGGRQSPAPLLRSRATTWQGMQGIAKSQERAAAAAPPRGRTRAGKNNKINKKNSKHTEGKTQGEKKTLSHIAAMCVIVVALLALLALLAGCNCGARSRSHGRE